MSRSAEVTCPSRPPLQPHEGVAGAGAQGPGATANRPVQDGVKAGVEALEAKGIELQTVLGDSRTSPAGAGSAGAELVQRDQVDTVLAVSALTLVAAPGCTRSGVPAVGVPQDGPGWLSSPNMFSVTGAGRDQGDRPDQAVLRGAGRHPVGTLAYDCAPQSVLSAKAAISSREAASLKNGYLNRSFSFGGTNVQPVALSSGEGGRRRRHVLHRPEHLPRAADRSATDPEPVCGEVTDETVTP